MQSLHNFNLSNRYCSYHGIEDDDGKVFVNAVADYEDLSNVNIIHKGVDTIKAKFNGTLQLSFVRKVTNALLGGYSPIFKLDGIDFILSYGSKASRYRYKLQARALGVIIHFGDIFLREENVCEPEKGKLKYEFSPNFIFDNGLDNIKLFISNFNQIMMHGFTPNGIDVHLCADVQGWKPTEEIVKGMVTFVRKAPYISHGVEEASIEYQSNAVRYGSLDTITWGSASSSQLSIYNKTKECKASGKTRFWDSVYNQNDYYSQEIDVFRVELRLPSNVIKNLVKRDDGTRVSMESIEDLENHINQLWVYGLSRLFRYDYDTSRTKKKTIKPIWQFLLDDVRFNDIYTPCDFKREYLVIDDAIDHNISLAIGNLTSAFAKAGYTEDEVIESITKMPLFKQIIDYAEEKKGMSELVYIDWVLQTFRIKKINFDSKISVSSDKFRAYRRFYKVSNGYSVNDQEINHY